jgi:hypothetical protein
MRQIYYPIAGRELIMPKMFEEEPLEVNERKSFSIFIFFIYLENFRIL